MNTREKIEIRVSDEFKTLVSDAAASAGMTMTSYIKELVIRDTTISQHPNGRHGMIRLIRKQPSEPNEQHAGMKFKTLTLGENNRKVLIQENNCWHLLNERNGKEMETARPTCKIGTGVYPVARVIAGIGPHSKRKISWECKNTKCCNPRHIFTTGETNEAEILPN
jgi:hypothetical protein